MIFRQMVAIYSRKDSGPDQGPARRSRLSLLWAAWRFARGTGTVPRLHAAIPETTFEAAETPFGPLSETSEKRLERYYLVKLESMQFCGPTNFHRRFWDGLDFLILTFPAIMWLTRVLAKNHSRDDAVTLALRIVDDNFGFNPLLGKRRQNFALSMLNFQKEIPRLVAWYAR
jgi:lysine-N-methylase